jgi:hypothetical protein
MRRTNAARKKRLQAAIETFELSENLRQFLPPTAVYSQGVRTPWFRVTKLQARTDVATKDDTKTSREK